MDDASSNPPMVELESQSTKPTEYNKAKREFEKKLWKLVTIIGDYSRGNYGRSRQWKCLHCKTNKSSSIQRVRYHLLGVESLKPTEEQSKDSHPGMPPFSSSSTSVHESQIGRMFDAIDRKNVDAAIGRLFFGCGMPFNIARSPLWKEAMRMVNNAPKGYVPPSYEKLRTIVLDDEKKHIEERLTDVRDSWSYTGVSIVSDGWTDIARRPLINILVCSPKGIMFMKSHDTSGHVKDTTYIAGLFREAIEQVGRNNVVQIITDNAANNALAGDRITNEFPNIFWTPCVVHCMNLLLKDLHNSLPWISEVVSNVKKIQHFIVNHSMSHAIYRKHASLQLLRCAETRFASNFIMVDRIVKVKQALRQMVVSTEWERWRDRPSTNSQACDEIFDLIIGSGSILFWQRVGDLLILCWPLIEVLRLFDNDKPCMGDVFEKLDQMREKLKNIFIVGAPSFDQETHDIVWNCSLDRWRMLHRPLHSVGFLLNPKWFHKKPWLDDEVSTGWKAYLGRVYPNREDRTKIKDQLSKYIDGVDNFSHKDVPFDRLNMEPKAFWENYRTKTPELRNTAIRVLSQVSSSSTCERNWSEYSFIHSVKRNRLGSKMAEDLVYIHSNLRLLSRASTDYKSGPHRMWDYGGLMDDGNDELPIEVLEDNVEESLLAAGMEIGEASGSIP
ncbi:uncharacterized protein LOC131855961 [Cryptomeria japonica]|uniref:uncharacterized protein LOC131855961 n=1 Tax=Cryptomeria japonica TaxID=3369 RepID=UPI0027DA807C|nr:uncharacterized protein LOC131855961 [Cryptomeria japonica]